MYVWDNPPSMSMLDGPNPIGQRVTMGVFNNLVMFDQHVKQSSLKSIVPDLATGWSWNEEGTALTLPLRKGVKWHDGKPFTAKDVQCTWDLLLDKSSDKLRINRDKPPFDNSDLRRAMALSLDRKAFIDILGEGQGDIGGVLQPAPEGLWGMPLELLKELPGYDRDVQKNRAQARRIMERLGYGPGNRLKLKVSTRDLRDYRDPAVILIDQL